MSDIDAYPRNHTDVRGGCILANVPEEGRWFALFGRATGVFVYQLFELFSLILTYVLQFRPLSVGQHGSHLLVRRFHDASPFA